MRQHLGLPHQPKQGRLDLRRNGPTRHERPVGDITLPARLNGIALNDALTEACPAQLATCYSAATVQANIDLDDAGDTILWSVDVELAAGSNVNVLKIVVYHEDDFGNVTLIPLTKKNVCKNLTQTDCGAAVIVQEGGFQILRVSFQTAGNGKGRF